MTDKHHLFRFTKVGEGGRGGGINHNTEYTAFIYTCTCSILKHPGCADIKLVFWHLSPFIQYFIIYTSPVQYLYKECIAPITGSQPVQLKDVHNRLCKICII